MAVILALAAALLFALGMVLQAQVASKASEEEARGMGFLVQLARKPRWLAGIAADALGFVAQAWALAIGRLVVVQPLLATAVVFALPLNAKMGGKHVSPREILAAITVTVGLGVFLVVADPTGGVSNPNATEWIVSFAVCGGISVALVIAARGRTPSHRAAMLGTAAGILFGLSAALTKTTVDQFGDGVLTVLENWQLYALIVVGWVSMTMSQAALQTNALAPAVATQMALDPIASVLLGTLAFEETIHETPSTVIVCLAAFAVMLAGLVYLALHQDDQPSSSS
jgi:drug/metabolite transporter (DMT)-like permease